MASFPNWASELAWLSDRDQGMPSALDGVNLVLTRPRLARFLADFARDRDVRDFLSLDALASALGLPLTSTGVVDRAPSLGLRPFRIWECVWLYKVLRLSRGEIKLLDLGGPAAHLSILASIAGCEVTSVDLNPDSVHAARECAQALELRSYQPCVGDLRDLSSLPDAGFDAVVSCSVLQHLTAADQETALQQVARVLKPSGVAGLTFDYGPAAAGLNEHLPSPHDPPPTAEAAVRRFSQGGLAVAGNPFTEDPVAGSLFPNPRVPYTIASLFLSKDPAVELSVPRCELKGSVMTRLAPADLPYKAFHGARRLRARSRSVSAPALPETSDAVTDGPAAQSPAEGENLIFLFSQPRAGSTLLQKILGAHPDIHTLSEPWLALHPLFGLREEGHAADYDAPMARTALGEFLRQLPEAEEAYLDSVRLMLNELYGRALDQSGKRFFLDKTPRYYFIISELRRTFPRARFVFLLRNPLAVLSSILDTWVPSEDPLRLRPFRHDLADAPRLLLEGIRNFGSQAAVVRYEDLISSPETIVRELCDQLRIPFHPAMIEYGKSTGQRHWMYGDQGTVHREQRPVQIPAVRWRSVLGSSAIWRGWARAYLEHLGRDLLAEFGYDYDRLVLELGVPPAASDWQQIVEPDTQSQYRLQAQLQESSLLLQEQNQQLAMFEAVVAERGAELDRKEAMLTEIGNEAARRSRQLESAIRDIEAREAHARELKATADERLQSMEDRDREIEARDARLAHLEAIADERLQSMRDRDREIEARDARLAQLESIADERLQSMRDRDREIEARDARLAQLESIAAERLQSMRDRDREIEARDARLAQLESTAAERLQAMTDRDREIVARDTRLTKLESVAAERLQAMTDRDREIAARDVRLAQLEAIAEERLQAMTDRDREIAARDARLAQLESIAAERLQAMTDRDREIAARDSRIAQLEAVAEERLRAMTDRDREIDARDARLAQLESVAAERLQSMRDCGREIDARDARLAQLESVAAERLQAMLDRDREIQAREARLAQLESVAAERLQAMLDRDDVIVALRSALDAQQAMEYSRGRE